jgi:uncharacterized tellurite resistance protein B-like protein
VDTNVAKALVVSKVLVADGMMTQDERDFLAGFLDTLGLTEEQRRGVIELEGIDDAEAVVRELPLEERRAILSTLVDAAAADGTLSPHELEVVKRVTAALGL